MFFSALAEFILRGRVQAVVVALLGSWVPLIAQATISLVTLRKGEKEGVLVSLWALLPAVAAIFFHQMSELLVLATVSVMVTNYAISAVLRSTVSWPAAMAVGSVMSAVLALALVFGLSGSLEQFRLLMARILNSDTEATKQTLEFFASWQRTEVSGVIAVWIATSAFTGLIVGRWWQAKLFNPGGFKKEFHGLRLGRSLGTSLVLAYLVCSLSGPQFGVWTMLVSLPLVIVGLGLAHCALAKTPLGKAGVAGLYVLLFLVPPLMLVLAIAATLDVWIDIRKKLNLIPQP